MRLLPTIKPTQNQLKVLAILANNQDDPLAAAKELSNGRNLVMARNILMDMGAITYSNVKAELTDVGRIVAQNNDIMDDGGNVTDFGQSLLSPEQQPEQQPVELAPTEELPPMESFSTMLKLLL